MKIKTSVLTAILVAAFPVGVKAQEVNSYEGYEVTCQSGTDCNDFKVDSKTTETDSNVAQTGRTRRTRSVTPAEKKFYIGGNLGGYIPGGDLDIGFGLGGLFGYNFSNQIAAELEVYDFFGGSNVDDLGYNFLGVAANGLYKYPFGNDSNSIYAFVGLGVGIGNLSATGDVADVAGDNGTDTSNTDVFFQWKVGVGYPLNNKLDLIGQFRAIKFDAENDTIENDGTFALEAGLKYNF